MKKVIAAIVLALGLSSAVSIASGSEVSAAYCWTGVNWNTEYAYGYCNANKYQVGATCRSRSNGWSFQRYGDYGHVPARTWNEQYSEVRCPYGTDIIKAWMVILDY